MAASPAQAGRVWALIEHKTAGGLYRSDDDGANWEQVSDNQNLISRAWYYMHLTADPQDPDTVYVNNLSFWKSTDGGKTFAEIATPHGDNHDLWIDPRNPQRMIQGNDGGANVSLNGGATWSTIYNQPTAQFYHIATDNRAPYHVYGTQQDNTSIAVPSRSHARRHHLGRLLHRRHRRERLHRRASRRPRHRLRRRDRQLARRRQLPAALRPPHPPDPADHHLAGDDGRLRRQRGQVSLRLDLPDRDLAARPEHALHRRQHGLQNAPTKARAGSRSAPT